MQAGAHVAAVHIVVIRRRISGEMASGFLFLWLESGRRRFWRGPWGSGRTWWNWGSRVPWGWRRDAAGSWRTLFLGRERQARRLSIKKIVCWCQAEFSIATRWGVSIPNRIFKGTPHFGHRRARPACRCPLMQLLSISMIRLGLWGCWCDDSWGVLSSDFPAQSFEPESTDHPGHHDNADTKEKRM